MPEAQLANLGVGQALSARSTAYADRTFEGLVSTVDARIDVATRAITVRGDFPNPDGMLRPGMLLQVQLARPARQALVLPEIALVQAGRDTFVFRVKTDGSVEQVKIQVAGRVEGKAAVIGDLSVGDKIVVDGVGNLREGAKVVEGNAPAAADGGVGRPPRTS